MKYIYIAILILMVILIFMRANHYSKMERTLSVIYSIRINVYAEIAIISYICTLLCENKRLAFVFYGIDSIVYIGMAYSFLLYVQVCTRTKKIPMSFRIFYGVATLFFTVCFGINVFKECFYSLEMVTDKTGNFFYAIVRPTWLYMLYYVFLYATIGTSVLFFLIRSVKVSRIYRNKYINLSLLIIGAGIVDCVYATIDGSVNYSLLAYALIALLLYYLFDFVPSGLLKQFTAYFVKNNERAYIFFDVFGRCQYRNSKAEEYYRIAGNGTDREKAFMGWLNGKEMQNVEEAAWERTREIDGVVRTFSFSFKQLYDEKSNYLGCFFIIEDVTEERNKYYKEWYQSTHDELTGLYNRGYFFEQATKEIAKHPDVNYCILCSDIYNFKMINDMFGVENGNKMLIQSAKRIREIVQEGDIYGRIGSDRFAICMPYEHFEESQLAEFIAKLEHMSVHDYFLDKVYYGIYENVGTDIPISIICDRTIMAINKIKGNMHEHLIRYDEKYHKQVRNEQQMMNDFNTSMRDRSFHLYLLPYVNEKGEVKGAEALVRWMHPIHGMMMPQEFVPFFEETGLISRLDLYIWELACKQLRRWKELGMEDFYISINISSRDFFYLDVYETLTNLVEQHEIRPDRLHLEITEIAVVSEFEKMLEIMNRLRDYGFRLYMDDFGNGYSSLNVLKDIPIDAIKIDMEFIQKSSQNEKRKKILNMIVGLSNKIGIDVIAEGVETVEQMEYINQIGCHTYQGYEFCKPVSIQYFEKEYLKKM